MHERASRPSPICSRETTEKLQSSEIGQMAEYLVEMIDRKKEKS